MKIIKQSTGVPAHAICAEATVLECQIHYPNPEDWKWLSSHSRKRGKPWPRRVKMRQEALRAYRDKTLISACVSIDSSVFTVFVDPQARASVFWEERRRQPSGRILTRFSGPGNK